VVEQIMTAVAEEARSRGTQQLLSPVLGLARDPRYGRIEETYGEDPFPAACPASEWSAVLDPVPRRECAGDPRGLVPRAGGRACCRLGPLWRDQAGRARLPVTIAQNAGQLPVYYYQKPSAKRAYLYEKPAFITSRPRPELHDVPV